MREERMSATNFFKIAFLISSCVFIVVLIFFVIYLAKKDKNIEYKDYLLNPIKAGIVSITAYCIFLVSNNHIQAVFFDSLFFIGTDWMAYFMMLFAIAYTGLLLKYMRQITICFGCLCGLDSISLFVNNWTHHSFDLVLMTSKFNVQYWGNAFEFVHYVHLGLCYIMVGITFVDFAIKSITTPRLYKKKYLTVFLAYLIVIICNMASYSLNFPIDYSVILYPVLASFICYYSIFSFPRKLLYQTLQNVNETVSDGFLYFDINGECIYSNKSAKQIFSSHGVFNLTKAELYQKKLAEQAGERQILIITDNIEIDGKNYAYEVEFKQEASSGYIIGSFIKLIDKTEEVLSFQKEKYQATHDELTGILNREGFLEAVGEDIKANGCNDTIILCSNIKDFKLVNELFGEKKGDEVLQKEANLLKQFAHNQSIYGRFSDDKFVLYCKKEYFNEDFFVSYINSLGTLTESNIYRMHVYVGIYEPKGHLETVQAMCDKAFMAMSEISRTENYNSIFCYYDSVLLERLLTEKNIKEEFEIALEKKQIEIYLQPIINSKNASFGAEALSRWNHPMRGMLYPKDFLPTLEKTGLVYQLDMYLWEQVAKKLAEWKEMGCDDCYISVNISLKDFFYTDLYKVFERLVDEYDIMPKNLHIEITELVLMSDFKKASLLAQKLQRLGFVVAIDNFGNGYSSLNMLKDFQANILKIDMAFLQNSKYQDEKNQIILKSIIKMAQNLDMEVIGEGVESKQQYDLLIDLNCPIIQGNYLACPISIEEYENKFIKYAMKG